MQKNAFTVTLKFIKKNLALVKYIFSDWEPIKFKYSMRNVKLIFNINIAN